MYILYFILYHIVFISVCNSNPELNVYLADGTITKIISTIVLLQWMGSVVSLLNDIKRK